MFVLFRWTRYVVVVAVKKMKNWAEEQDSELVLRGTRKMAFLVKLSWKLLRGLVLELTVGMGDMASK